MFKQIATAAAACLLAGQVAASDTVLPSPDSTFIVWGEESGWTIYIDEDRQSCLIERVDDNENVVQMGLTADHQMGYFGVFSKNIELRGESEQIVLLIDENLYYGEAALKTKNLADGYVGGYVLTNNPLFVEDVMRKYDMIVFPETSYAFVVSLDGTLKAIEAAQKCNMEQLS